VPCPLRFVTVRLHTEQQEHTSTQAATLKPGSSTRCWGISLSRLQSLLSAQPSFASWGKCLVSFPLAQAPTQTGEGSCDGPAPAQPGRKHPSPAGRCLFKGPVVETPRGTDTAKLRAGTSDILRHRNCFCLVCLGETACRESSCSRCRRLRSQPPGRFPAMQRRKAWRPACDIKPQRCGSAAWVQMSLSAVTRFVSVQSQACHGQRHFTLVMERRSRRSWESRPSILLVLRVSRHGPGLGLTLKKGCRPPSHKHHSPSLPYSCRSHYHNSPHL